MTLALLGVSQAKNSLGSCPTPALQQNFDAVKYTGVWFEQIRDGGMPWEFDDCQQARYTLNEDGTVGVYNTQFNTKTQQVEGASAVATFEGAKGAVKFFSWAPAGDYEVLSTDYDQYAVVYSCSSLAVAKFEYIWVLTRDRYPADGVVQSAKDIITSLIPDYDVEANGRVTNQGDSCVYYNGTASSTSFTRFLY